MGSSDELLKQILVALENLTEAVRVLHPKPRVTKDQLLAEPDAWQYRLTEVLFLGLVRAGVMKKRLTDVQKKRWVLATDQLHRIDGFAIEDIEQVYRFIVTDYHEPQGPKDWRGWAWVAQTPVNLRPKADGSCKFETILGQANGRQSSEKMKEQRYRRERGEASISLEDYKKMRGVE